jgi:hypothetical protein
MQLPSPVILNSWKRFAGGLKGRKLAKAAAPNLVGAAPLAGPLELLKGALAFGPPAARASLAALVYRPEKDVHTRDYLVDTRN